MKKILKAFFVLGIFAILPTAMLASPSCDTVGGVPVDPGDPACYTENDCGDWRCAYVSCHGSQEGQTVSCGQSCEGGHTEYTNDCGDMYCNNGYSTTGAGHYTCYYLTVDSWSGCDPYSGVQSATSVTQHSTPGTSCDSLNEDTTRICPASCGTNNGQTFSLESDFNPNHDAYCNPGNDNHFQTRPSEFSSANGDFYGKWTWNCTTNTTVDCLAYKQGVCNDEPTPAPYEDSGGDAKKAREKACTSGHFNSVSLNNGILTWKCGTGDTDKTVGSFTSSDSTIGDVVTADYYTPTSGGTDCQCTPTYEYSCVSLGTSGDCTGHCGETIEEEYGAFKHDISCFPNEPLVSTTKEEYQQAPADKKLSGDVCANGTITCAPCGTSSESTGQGGSYHETN